MFEYPELPPELNAETLYEYVVDVTSPVSEKVVTFAPTVATLLNDVPSVERWILKPVSLLE